MHYPTRKTQLTPHFYLSLLEFLLNSKRQIVQVGEAYDLTAVQAITLMLLDGAAPRPIGSFTRLFHCDASNVTGIIDGLEQKGLVERRSDPKDRRIKVVYLLAKGKTVQQAMLGNLSGTDSFPFDSLGAIERKQLLHIIEKLARANSSI